MKRITSINSLKKPLELVYEHLILYGDVTAEMGKRLNGMSLVYGRHLILDWKMVLTSMKGTIICIASIGNDNASAHLNSNASNCPHRRLTECHNARYESVEVSDCCDDGPCWI